MAHSRHATPLLDELDKGPWPSFVREMKKMADRNPMVNDLLGQLETSYSERIGHWKHGGIVGVMGYGGGVIGRYSDIPEKYPQVEHFHTIRVNQPSGWFYTADVLRKLCDIWEKHGSGLTNMHGSTGDMVFLGCRTEALEPIFAELTALGFDLGGSGSDMRTPSCCVGRARCEWACYDTMATCYQITQDYQDELHRPAFPYKWKFKFAGCANDCVASIARSDCSIIGTWRDDIRQDDAAVAEYAAKGLDIARNVVNRCPTRCMAWDGKKLSIDNAECVKCMHCINVMPKALRTGTETGASILIGAKAPIVQGAQLGQMMVPFVPEEELVDSLKELTEAVWEFWDEHGKNRERVGELIQRVGMGNFLEAIGLPPAPEMVSAPRANPYIFYKFDVDEEE